MTGRKDFFFTNQGKTVHSGNFFTGKRRIAGEKNP
jgi:hypothetical protein